MSDASTSEEELLVDDRRTTRETARSRPLTFLELGSRDERRLRRETREKAAARRVRAAEDSARARVSASTDTVMATSSMSQTSSQSTSSGVSQSGSQGSISQTTGLRVSQHTQLTPEDLEIRQAEELQDELQRQLDEAAETRRRAILRKARPGSRREELGRLEGLDEAALDPVVRILRNALLSVAEVQNVQQELLAELVAGQKQILAELRAPRTMMRQPQFVVVPPMDIGSTRNFISRARVDRLRLGDQVQRLSRTVASTLANKHQMVVKDYVKDIACTFSYGGGEVIHKISFLVSDELPFDMLLGMYYLEVSQLQFDWDRKVLIHKLPNGRTVGLQKHKASSLVENYGCMCASSFYNYYKQNREEGMYLVFVSEKGETAKSPPEIEKVIAQYSDLFEEPTGVVEREVVHVIEVVPGSKVPRGRIYRMSPAELDELRRHLKEFTEKGWIRPSTSPYGAPVLFIPKKGGPLRMCIDYRGLNAITVKNAEPLPRIDDLLDRVQGCRYFTKIDLKSGYHQIAVRPEDQHKTAFQTRYGLYEFVVMPFGLCNAPGIFQHAMNRIFHDYLDKFIVVYLDDILIFSRTVEEHAEHLKIVLGLLRQHQYKVNLDKCEFGGTKILYLGHEISTDGLRPEGAKVASIRDWPGPQTVTKLQLLNLGLQGIQLFVDGGWRSEGAEVAEHCDDVVDALLQLAGRGCIAGLASLRSWCNLLQVLHTGIKCPCWILMLSLVVPHGPLHIRQLGLQVVTSVNQPSHEFGHEFPVLLFWCRVVVPFRWFKVPILESFDAGGFMPLQQIQGFLSACLGICICFGLKPLLLSCCRCFSL
ncbi:hypothetical protein CBR_g21090 [Chara braunii]|uniref:Reverse transcriptase domain-containing protein n=1 Tax=Chara braunii TaxID=69332 RepID=A0A388L0J6_CHABU|nr:hypothetical protein CBR_g21090 [Chara braunii]|eukprot:GBG75846.1 hypothetical protein CBR_g21090 [Chara braunii]